MTNQLSQAIDSLLHVAIEKGYIHPLDRLLKQNQLLNLFKVDEYIQPEETVVVAQAKDLLPTFLAIAVQTGLIDDSQTDKEILSAKIMAVMTPDTSVLNQTFWNVYNSDSPEQATNYFYDLSQDNNYIQTEAIAKNIAFKTASPYGDLEVTINLSKPEKDPKAIAAAKSMPTSAYPKCQLCLENEGYAGHLQHPARSNHRIIRFPLLNETWGLQYSPYAYYNEHCIFLSADHRPMRISGRTFENLFAIVEQFPHYFVGSNADLPIVGGSILSHDHYQGGRYSFPMDKAPVIENFDLEAYPQTSFGLVKWPLSVIRLSGKDKAEMEAAAVHILEKWRAYSDPEADILAFSGETPHNTITPIARRDGDSFICDLVLRNNRTTDEHPDGLFHPHSDVQHIKKENIGLIEVMGLAILPPRLKDELEEVKAYLLGKENSIQPMHLNWARRLADSHAITADNVDKVVENGVGKVFQRVLEDAGVYKLSENGLAAFRRFVKSL